MHDIQLGIYRHFKGGVYEVIDIAKHSETLEPLVVYRALYGEQGMWVRPLAMWNEQVSHDGVVQPRFTYLADSLDDLDHERRFTIIEKVVEALYIGESEYTTGFFHLPTNRVVYIDHKHFEHVEADESDADTQQWERDAINEARYLLDHEDEYANFPRQVNEYPMMESFTEVAPIPPRQRENLRAAIQGKGAYRRFRDTLMRTGLEQLWYDYRESGYRRLAREWCDEHGIMWAKSFILPTQRQ